MQSTIVFILSVFDIIPSICIIFLIIISSSYYNDYNLDSVVNNKESNKQ